MVCLALSPSAQWVWKQDLGRRFLSSGGCGFPMTSAGRREGKLTLTSVVTLGMSLSGTWTLYSYVTEWQNEAISKM